MKNILLIGRGGWGQKIAKTLADKVQLQIRGKDWKGTAKPDGVIIATPPGTHIHIASHFLEQNIPVFIEKPLSLSSEEAEQLTQYTAPILVNHLYLFSQGYQELKKADKINYLHIDLLGNRETRTYSVLFDIGSHAISIMLDLFKTMPVEFNIIPLAIKDKLKELYIIFFKFPSSQKACMLFGNEWGQEMRNFKIFTESGSLIYNDVKKPIDHNPPLTNALNIFLQAIDGQMDERLGVNLGINTLKVLEKAWEKLKL